MNIPLPIAVPKDIIYIVSHVFSKDIGTGPYMDLAGSEGAMELSMSVLGGPK